jgi:hypothetical protein
LGQRSRQRERSPATPPAPPTDRDRMAARYARGRGKDAEARARLKPLAEGERPIVLTGAAIVAALLAAANIASVFLVDSRNSQLGVAVVQCVVLLVAAWGMWKAKYWAVLGFECLLALQIIVLCLALLVVERVIVGIVVAAVIAALGFLFYKLIRVMARVQMPERRPRDAAG